VKRTRTPTFAVTLPLTVTPRDERLLAASFEAGRRLYNACLGEALRRLQRLRRTQDWQRARELARLAGKKPNPQRRALFKRAEHACGFTSASISSYGTTCKNQAHWEERLGAHETQRIAERAFSAAQQYASGLRGRPRFKGWQRPLHSIEAKTNANGIRYKRITGVVQWGSLILPVRLPSACKDRHEYVQRALACRTKYCRIVWRMIHGKRRWFVQLLQQGVAPQRYRTVADAVVGLDVGPSTVAVTGDTAAGLFKLAPDVEQPWRQVRRIQRAMNHSRRATNPQAFNPDGTYKHGARIAVRSARYTKLRQRLAETERVLAARRNRAHGALANAIVGLGNAIQAEQLSYKSFPRGLAAR
jgi:hypothetical protein